MGAERTGYYFELYKDSKDKYRWRFWAPNGRSMADSGEGYEDRTECIAAIDRLCTVAQRGPTILIAPNAQD